MSGDTAFEPAPEPLYRWRAGLRGYGRHLAVVGKPWSVRIRRRGEKNLGELASTHSRSSTAYAAAHEARKDVDTDTVVDLVEWVLGGLELRESLPRLLDQSVPPGGLDKEIIWGYSGQPIAVIKGWRRHEWAVLMRNGEGAEVFESPSKVRDAIHPTRAAAIAAAHRFAGDLPDDEGWPDRWIRALRITSATAGSATLSVDLRVVGATGTRCSYPQCSTEAEWILQLSGSDIGNEPAQLCCLEHATSTSAPILIGSLPD